MLEKFSFWFFLLALGPVSKSFAGELAESYRSRTQTVLNDLKTAQINEMGCEQLPSSTCFRLSDFQRALDKVRIVETSKFQKPELATRWTAFSSPEDDTIYLNLDVPHEESTRGFVGLHELSRIVGADDEEYSYTIAAYAYARALKQTWGTTTEKEQFLSALKGQLKTNFLSRSETAFSKANGKLQSGGGTIFGGGGDGSSLVQRLLFYDYLMNSTAPIFKKPMLAGLFKMSIPIEIVDNDSDLVTYIIELDNGWPQHILVPRKLTQTPPQKDLTAPNRALEDIGFYYSSLLSKDFFGQFNPPKFATKYVCEKSHYLKVPRGKGNHPALEDHFHRLYTKYFHTDKCEAF